MSRAGDRVWVGVASTGLWVIAPAMALRILLELALHRSGYLFGMGVDTFVRARLAWSWANQPFLDPSGQLAFDWMPLQIWVNGVLYRLSDLANTPINLYLPVAVNQLWFAASLSLTYVAARRMGSQGSAAIAVVLATFLRSDVWVTFSGLSEPQSITCGLALGLLTMQAVGRGGVVDSRGAILMGFAALLGAANHFVGWALAAYAAGFMLLMELHSRRRRAHGSRGRVPIAVIIGGVLALAFPLAWMIVSATQAGEPLGFLSRSASYHDQFLGEQTTIQRAALPFALLWRYELPLTIVGIVAMVWMARRRPTSLSYMLPGLVHLAALSVAGAMHWMPYSLSQVRFTVFELWLALPLIATMVWELLTSGKVLRVVVGAGLSIGLLVYGGVNTFRYTNYIDTETLAASNYLRSWLRTAGREARILVESNRGWDRKYVDVLVGNPENFVFQSGDDIRQASEGGSLIEFGGASLWVLKDPETIAAVQGVLKYRETFGELVFFDVPDESPEGGLAQDVLPQWSLLSQGEFAVRIPPDTIVVGFSVQDPERGDQAGIEGEFPVEANHCYVVSAHVRDYYGWSRFQGRFSQQLAVNGSVIWEHDISGDDFEGWIPVELQLKPTESPLLLTWRIVTLGSPEKGWEWGRAARMGVRSPRIAPCQVSASGE